MSIERAMLAQARPYMLAQKAHALASPSPRSPNGAWWSWCCPCSSASNSSSAADPWPQADLLGLKQRILGPPGMWAAFLFGFRTRCTSPPYRAIFVVYKGRYNPLKRAVGGTVDHLQLARIGEQYENR